MRTILTLWTGWLLAMPLGLASGQIRTVPYQDVIEVTLKVGANLELEFEERVASRVLSDLDLKGEQGVGKDLELGLNKKQVFLRLNTLKKGEITLFGEESEDGEEQNHYRFSIKATEGEEYDLKVHVKKPLENNGTMKEKNGNSEEFKIKDQIQILSTLLRKKIKPGLVMDIRSDEFTGRQMPLEEPGMAKGILTLGRVYEFPEYSVRFAIYRNEATITTPVPVERINYRDATLIHSSPWTVNPGEEADVKIFYRRSMS